MSYQILNMDCVDAMQLLIEDNSVDAIVTDPPYGLSFMGKKWDYDVPSVDVWREAFRVLKPGGHLLAFAGTRTQHRMAVNIEDAGFEIRDLIAWVYGSGFPKSLNVANAMHDAAIGQPQGGSKPGSKNHGRYKSGCTEENKSGRGFGAGPGQFMAEAGEKVERQLVEAAKRWQGWGTALKPALEPITVARKPLVGTVASNVLEWGTGALNVDGCRVALSEGDDPRLGGKGAWTTTKQQSGDTVSLPRGTVESSPLGRWPANLIHDGSDEVLAAFPETHSSKARGSAEEYKPNGKNKVYGDGMGGGFHPGFNDSGSAARFFYCPKASKSDRGEGNTHPTVKPVELMRYLCRLVTPPSGLILDPFTGSGTTGVAALLEGFRFIGTEQDEAYVAIAEARLAHEVKQMLKGAA